MKKILIIISLFAVVSAFADAKSDELLSRLSSKIASLGAYRVEFEVETEGNDMQGVYIVSGDRYRLITEEYEVISDGRIKYEINHYDMEVLIDSVNPADRSILSNPTRAFEFAGDMFASSFAREEKHGAVTWDVVSLKPADRYSSFTEIILKINSLTSLPAELYYRMDGLSGDVVITVDSFNSDPSVKDSDFRFDRSLYADYEIVDFR